MTRFRALWVVAVAGCVACAQTDSGREPIQRQPPPAPVVAPRPVPAPAPPPAKPPAGMPPGGAIQLAAVAPGDDAALTFDSADEVRLWPRLDAAHPPVAVALPVAHAAALDHACASLRDAARLGEAEACDHACASLRDAARLGEAEACDHACASLRDAARLGEAEACDHACASLRDAARLGEAEACDHACASLRDAARLGEAEACDHACASLRDAARLGEAEACDHAGDDFVAVLALDTAAVHVRLDAAGHRRAVRELAPIDGVAAVLDGFVTWRGKRLELLDRDGQSIASLDAGGRVTSVARGATGGAIVTVGKATRALELHREPGQPAALALGAAASAAAEVVTPAGSDLAIATPAGRRYLGYAFVAQPVFVPDDATRPLVAGPPGRWLQLDLDLAAVRELAPPVASATDLTWLGGDDWLVADKATALWIWTFGEPAAHRVRATSKLHGYDADSRLAIVDDHQLARYAPDRHALDDVPTASWGDAEPHLVSPKLAHGAVLLLTTFERRDGGVEHGTATWLRDVEHPDRGKTAWQADHAWPVTEDRDGRVLVQDQRQAATTNKILWLTLDDAGKETPSDRDGSTPLWHSPDGSRTLAIDEDARTLALTGRDGRRAWSVALPKTVSVYELGSIWADDADAYLVSPRDIAKIDLAHGRFGPVGPGWGFELSPSPHPASELGRPLAHDLAPGDGELVLPGDAAFQTLVRDIAKRVGMYVTLWGPMKMDGGVHRVALMQTTEETGTPRWLALVEVDVDHVIAAQLSGWGFHVFQGPYPPTDPTWGTGLGIDEVAPPIRTIDLTEISVKAQWIHMSFEALGFTLERGRLVVVADDWAERENTGHSIETTTGEGAVDDHPALAGYEAHSIEARVSAPGRDPAVLAAVAAVASPP